MIGHFSRRRAQIEARYAELVRELPARARPRPRPRGLPPARPAGQPRHPPGQEASRARSPDKRAAWRDELTAAFGPGAVQPG